jgi:hypothetical protein
MHTVTQRIVGALKLDNAIYEEIEHDPAATRQAAILVAVIALIGALISAGLHSGNIITAFLGQLVSTYVAWLAWAVVLWLIGTKVFKAEADVPEMLRVTGFAYAPALLSAIPCVNVLVFFWLLATGFIAARAGLDLDNAKTVITILLGLLALIAVMMVITIPLGIGAALMNPGGLGVPATP